VIVVHTIGFTGKSAEQFFELLRANGIVRVLDVRLHNTSQLAGFAKRSDLPFFLREICGAAYEHEPLLAPSEELLADYQKRHLPWADYEPRFRALLEDRRVGSHLHAAGFEEPTALLCAEPKPDHCHRRLVAEHLAGLWPNVEIVHL
jgi:uncharacterized protein (DUF488 family)